LVTSGVAAKTHPNKHIRAAIAAAVSSGWTWVQGGKSHAKGTLKCPFNPANGDTLCRDRKFCTIGVWGTPQNPESFANRFLQKVHTCSGKKKAK